MMYDEQNWNEANDHHDGYEEDLAAQYAVEDAKYETPEQEEPSDLDYYDPEDGEDEDDMPSDGRYDHDAQHARGALPGGWAAYRSALRAVGVDPDVVPF